MKDTKVYVEGMHCKSCEMLVKEDVEEIIGVYTVNADYNKGIVEIKHKEAVDLKEVKSKIRELGYTVVENGGQ